MYTLTEKIKLILDSKSIEEVQAKSIMPETRITNDYYFISYSHKDYKLVFPLILELLEKGLNIWYDRGLENGLSWLDYVKKKVYSYDCKGIIYFVSDNCLDSKSLNEEYLLSRKYSKNSIIYLLNCDFIDNLFNYLENKKLDLTIFLKNIDNEELKLKENEIVFLNAFSTIRAFKVLDNNDGIDSLIDNVKKMPLPKLIVYQQDEVLEGYSIKYIRDLSIKEVEIPSQYKNEKIVGLKEGAFANCTSLEKVIIGDNIVEIRDYAFFNCYSLKKVIFNNKSECSLNLSAFEGCLNLKSLYIPRNINILNDSASHLEKIELEGKSDDIISFSNCPNLEFLILNDCEVIDKISNCPKLKNITIPNNCKKLRPYAFNKLIGLDRITIPKNVKKIPKGCFNDCINLKEIVFNSSKTEIESMAFRNCQKLESITIDNLTKIEAEAFIDCIDLKFINIKSDVLYLSNNSFINCNNLKTAYLDVNKLIHLESKINEVEKIKYFDLLISSLNIIYLTNKKIKLSSNFKEVISDKENYYKFVRDENGN